MAQFTGEYTWELNRATDWGRQYKLTTLYRKDNIYEGPEAVLSALAYQPGAAWIIPNAASGGDASAYCLPDLSVKPYEQQKGHPHTHFIAEQTFSTNKTQQGSCSQAQVDNPLLQPDRISGSFSKYQEEATYDRFGRQLVNSAFEQLRGPQVEFDRNRPSVEIEQNVPLLEWALLARLVDCVNSVPLWGLPPRCVKLSDVSWEAKFYGQCFRYYTRKLKFDGNYETFDRLVLDEGSKCLWGHWDVTTGSPTSGKWVTDNIPGTTRKPQATNPSDFMLAIDRAGNPLHVILNGAGLPYDPTDANEAKWWCVVGVNLDPSLANTSYCLAATCAEALAEVEDLNHETPQVYAYSLFGPFGNLDAGSENCHDTCDLEQEGGDFDPFAIFPPQAQDCSKPGRILIQKYREADFSILRIPLDIG